MPEELLEQLRRQSDEHYKAEKDIREKVNSVCEELHRFRDRVLGDGNGADSLRGVVKRNETRVEEMGNWIQDEITRRKALDEIDAKQRLSRQRDVDAASRRTKLLIAVVGICGPALTLVVGKLVGA